MPEPALSEVEGCLCGEMKLLISVYHRFSLWNPPAWLGERLRRDFPALEVVHLPGYEGLTQEVADAEILIGWSLTAEQFRAATKLRWIHSPAAAVHQLLIPEIAGLSCATCRRTLPNLQSIGVRRP